MTVIVTGGAGFIGSHTVERLVAEGYEVVVVDNMHSSSFANASQFSKRRVAIKVVDVADYNALREGLQALVRPGDVEGIVHLAAIVSVVEAEEAPQRTLNVNVKGTLNVLELARRFDAGKVIYASSVAVYGEPLYLPIDEDHPLQPVNLYGYSKLAGEQLLDLYSRRYGIKSTALRYFNVYGPRMRPGPYAGVIYKFIKALLRRESPAIHGDGEQTRDFIYVSDVAEANLKALESGHTGPVNIGSGSETSINKLYQLICRLITPHSECAKPHHEPPRPGDIRRSKASIKKAQETLGWRPRTTLEQGLRETIKYYLNAQLGRYSFQYPPRASQD